MSHTSIEGERLLRLSEVKTIVAMGSSTIYRHMDAGTFPRPVSLGPATVRWKASEIQAWIGGLGVA
ncbi:helix-turn-helix transcriptional regulator [Aureimonas altamirensis]|uniref:helix-turn-helix transcriptional regulator n=1 Tax=Aureimonas altamirensis TaxID=370622 RepID=UPI003D81B3E6